MRSDLKPIIRRATRGDINTIVAWQIAMASETEGIHLDQETVCQGVTRVFNAPQIGYYLIAEIDSKPVACSLVLSEWSDWRNGHVLWIHSVYVLAEHRKSGVFRTIYTYLKASVSADPAFRGLRLYVDKSNFNAIKTYESLGMSADHYQMFEWMK